MGKWNGVINGIWYWKYMEAEIHIGRLLVDSGCVQTLAHIDPEGRVAKRWCREIDRRPLRGAKYRRCATQMLLKV
jgi:hypothetical protein